MSLPFDPHAQLRRDVNALLARESPYRHEQAIIDRVVHRVLGKRYPAVKKRGKLVRRIVSRIIRES